MKQTAHEYPSDSEGRSILFLIFKIRKGAGQDSSSIELLSRMERAGKVKQEDSPSVIAGPCLTVDIYWKNRIIRSRVIEHPLYKHIEYADENGVLRSKDIELEEAEFFVRMQLEGDAVKISETATGKPKTTLIHIKL